MSEAATKKAAWYHIIRKEWGVESDQPVWADGIYVVEQGYLHGRLIRLSLRDRLLRSFLYVVCIAGMSLNPCGCNG